MKTTFFKLGLFLVMGLTSVLFYSCDEDEPDNDTVSITNTDSNTGDSGTNTGTNSNTSGYTITRTSVCSIVASKDSKTGTKYSNSYYKWVTSTGRVILSISSTNTNYWIGVASKNNDSTCKGYVVSSYTYKFVDYSHVGVIWYHYFN